MPESLSVFSRETALALDARDPLPEYRDRFSFPDDNLIYLDGNSLGRLPDGTADAVDRTIRQGWGRDLIRSWNSGWMDLPFRIGNKIAGLIGASAGEVAIADSTSVNLFKLAASACLHDRRRTKVITDSLNFPSDLYIFEGLRRLLPDLEVQIIRSVDGIHGPTDEIVGAIDDATALVSLSHTAFKSGFVYDMAAVNKAARRHGALTLWDLSHSAGAVPVDLSETGSDLAVGCTYKYLNGGPGAPAFLYVRSDLQSRLDNPVSGWMGQRNPFEFGLSYDAKASVSRFLTGTPAVLALTAMECGVDLVAAAGIDRLRRKSVAQTGMLEALWSNRLRHLDFTFNSPTDAKCRGSHVSLGHVEGLRVDRALIEQLNVLPDFRAPDNLRLGIAPLYTRYVDIYDAVERMERVVRDGLYREYSSSTGGVT